MLVLLVNAQCVVAISMDQHWESTTKWGYREVLHIKRSKGEAFSGIPLNWLQIVVK